MLLSFPKLKEAGKLGNELTADQDDATAGHELLDALALCAGVIIAVTFQEVDNAPNAKACADSGHEGLKNLNAAAEKCHIVLPKSACHTAHHENKKAPEIVPVLRKLALFLSLFILVICFGDKGGTIITRELPGWAAGYISSFLSFLLIEVFCISLDLIDFDQFFSSNLQFPFQKALHIEGVSLIIV